MKKQGYISQMKSMVSELKQYEVTKEDMDLMLDYAKNKPELYYKLKDISVLYQGFFDYLEGNFITQEEVLEVLGRVAGKSGKAGRERDGPGRLYGFYPYSVTAFGADSSSV